MIILLRNLLGHLRRWQVITTILLVFTISWGIAAFLVNIFQCWPPQYFWREASNPSIRGTCTCSRLAFYVSIGAISLLEDVFLLSLPVGIVWGLKIETQHKVELTGLFTVGSLYVLPKRPRSRSTVNFSFSVEYASLAFYD